MATAYNVTCSIVLYKNDDAVKKAIQSFLNSSLQIKLYLIDNSPHDVLRYKLKEFLKDERVEYIFNNKNLGYGSGHNIALRKTVDISEFHLVLNPDVYFDPAIINELYKVAKQDSTIGQIMPKVLYPSGNLQYSCKLIPTPLNLIARLLPWNFFSDFNSQFELRFTGYNQVMNIPYLQGSFMFLRCVALKEIGLFDERFFMYPEDIDLTRRMHKKYKTIFYPYVHIIHEHTKSSFKSIRMFAVHVQNIIRYFNKWGWFFDKERKQTNAIVLQELKENNA